MMKPTKPGRHKAPTPRQPNEVVPEAPAIDSAPLGPTFTKAQLLGNGPITMKQGAAFTPAGRRRQPDGYRHNYRVH